MARRYRYRRGNKLLTVSKPKEHVTVEKEIREENFMTNSRSDRIKKLMFELVRIQSDTGTRQEKDVETYLNERLGQREYFKKHPDYFGLYPLGKDPLERSVVWGLIKGQGDQSVILMHLLETSIHGVWPPRVMPADSDR